jgi:hypothetical protein
MSENTSPPTSEPVNVNALAILAGDVLATRAKALCDQLAAGDWPPLAQLKEAVSTYSEVRLGSTIADSQPPEPLPTCEDCKHGGRCDRIPSADCFEPVTLRTGEASHAVG